MKLQAIAYMNWILELDTLYKNLIFDHVKQLQLTVMSWEKNVLNFYNNIIILMELLKCQGEDNIRNLLDSGN
jgi:hypothetical protein